MKLFKKIRKGFTLIELVVVIAVIAILSAVSVVSYVAITNNAKNTADISAVKQMNTILAGNSVNDLNTINDVFDSFKENGLSGENYKPLYKDRYFFWDSAKNQIVYTDANYQVLYPESLKGTSDRANWFSLTQEIKTVDVSTIKTVTPATSTTNKKVSVEVSSPEQLFTVGKELKEAMLTGSTSGGYSVYGNSNGIKYIKEDIVIDLTQDLNLMGGAFNFNVRGNFTLNGHGHKITGIVNNKDFCQSASNKDKTSDEYGTSIVGYAAGESAEKRSVVKFIDVTIENCQFGSKTAKGASALLGYASFADVEIDRVHVKNCDMVAMQHSVGGFIGDVQQDGSTNIITVKGANSLSNCRLEVVKKEGKIYAYGVGYFIGRECHSNASGKPEYLTVTSTGATFDASTGNSKVFPNNTETVDPAAVNCYKYWDNISAGVLFTA